MSLHALLEGNTYFSCANIVPAYILSHALIDKLNKPQTLYYINQCSR